MERVIDAKIWKTGNAYVVTIPSKIIKKFKLKNKDEIEIILKK